MKRFVVFGTLAAFTTPLVAQTAADSGADKGELQEIVVTAQKREQNLQDVPAAVVAFTPAALRNSGIDDAIGLQERTPGLLVSTNGPYGQPYVRGVGSDIINPGTDAPVAIFQDGAYQPRPNAAITEFYDVDRVEVLKGPQGTLYGRNATGGAINIMTHDPEPFDSADGDAIFGNYGRVTARGALNAPVNDTVSVRVAAMYTEHEGYDTNLLNGDKLDNQNLWGLRGKVKFAPSDAFSLVFTAEHTREHDSRDDISKIVDSPGLPLPVRDLAPLLGYTAPTIPADPRSVYNNSQDAGEVNETRFNAQATWQLAHVQIKSITGYTDVANTGTLDLDGTEIDFSYDREQDSSRSIFESVQVSSTDHGPFQWISGLEYLHESAAQNFDARVPLFGPPSDIPFGPTSPIAGFIWASDIKTNAASAYVDGTYDLTSQLSFNAGVRYSWEQKRADFLETIIDPFGVLSGTPGTFYTPAHPEATFKAWTPKFRLEYRPANDLLLYAAATRGFKSGGFNLMNTGEEFQPEKIWSYEGGVKSTWLDHRLRANADAFYYNYKDLQVNQFSGLTNLVTNAANSRITGFELETVAQPVEAVQADFSVAYLDAIYKDYFTHSAVDPTGPLLDLSGNRMPKAPRLTATVGAQYAMSMPVGHLTFRGESRYQSLVYFDQFDTPQLTQGGFFLFNARATYTPQSERWSVAIFGLNLADKLYRQSMVRVDNVFGTAAFFGAPRTFGVEFSYHSHP
jgi:iron complex outermembrane receptor protein